jgi:outer membrane protein assembly factor BamC
MLQGNPVIVNKIRKSCSSTVRFIVFTNIGFLMLGCGMLDTEHKWDYLKSGSSADIQVPDNLQQPEQSREFEVPADHAAATDNREAITRLEEPPVFVVDKVLSTEDKQSVAASKANRLIVREARSTDGYSLLVVDAEFDIVWERVGQTFKEIGFTIEDKNRGQGLYSIYQGINKVLTEEEEFLRPRFDKGAREEYQVHVEDRDIQSRITIRNTRGKIDDSALAKNLLTQIKSQLSKMLTEDDRAIEVDRTIEDDPKIIEPD